ncbi:MAG: 50S ribosomal protein L18 [Bacillota bacterium]
MGQLTRLQARERRHRRVRKKVFGTPERPRLSVHRSLKHMYAQIIDDTRGQTLAFVSTLDPALRGKLKKTGDKEAAKAVGLELARRAKEQGVTRVVFDRGGFLYHGRVAAVAEGAREGGLEF